MKNAVTCDSLASFNSSSVTGNFQAINPLGFGGPAVLIRLNNTSNKPVAISYDGAHAHDFLLANSVLEINNQTNAPYPDFQYMFKKGTVVYISGEAGSGYLYLSVYHV